jgi:hypothetical protein
MMPKGSEHGDEEYCPRNKKGHEPDWPSTSVTQDRTTVYIDVACKHCGRSGCIASIDKTEVKPSRGTHGTWEVSW